MPWKKNFSNAFSRLNRRKTALLRFGRAMECYIGETEFVKAVKSVGNLERFNQIDKRRGYKYVQILNTPEQIVSILERYTGEAEPNCEKPRDKSLQSCSIATIRNNHSPKRRSDGIKCRFDKMKRRKKKFFRRLVFLVSKGG